MSVFYQLQVLDSACEPKLRNSEINQRSSLSAKQKVILYDCICNIVFIVK